MFVRGELLGIASIRCLQIVNNLYPAIMIIKRVLADCFAMISNIYSVGQVVTYQGGV